MLFSLTLARTPKHFYPNFKTLRKKICKLRFGLQPCSAKYLTIYFFSDEFAELLLQEVQEVFMSLSPTFSATVKTFMKSLGRSVMEQIYFNQWKDNEPLLKQYTQVYKEYIKWFLDPVNHEQIDAKSLREAFALTEFYYSEGYNFEMTDLKWPGNLNFQIGRKLFTAIEKLSVDMCKENTIIVDDMEVELTWTGDLVFSPAKEEKKNCVPAIYRVQRLREKGTSFEIRAHPILSKLFEMKPSDNLALHSSTVPMLVPPLPWSAPDRGGFMIRPSVFCRLPQNDLSDKQLNDYSERQRDAHPVFDALNVLGKLSEAILLFDSD